MRKTLLILAFSNLLTSELILEITQGTEDPYRVAILKFEGADPEHCAGSEFSDFLKLYE